MKLKDDFKIAHKNTSYVINTKKLNSVISLLENKTVELKSIKEAEFYMKKYGLFDSTFLENISL